MPPWRSKQGGSRGTVLMMSGFEMLAFASLSQPLCEVFGHGLDEIGSRHEDGEGADDGEEREGHQAQPVHHRRCELPLAADGLSFVLLSEAPGYVLHFLQDP